MPPPDAPVVKTIAIAAPPDAVWRVLTWPALIVRWMSDEPLVVEADWRAGGAIRFSGVLHGLDFENRGAITAFDPPHVFEYAYWSTLSASRLAETEANRTRVRFALAPEAGGSLLTLALRDFPEPSIRPHAELYWGVTLGIIRDVAEGRQTSRPGPAPAGSPPARRA